MKNIAAVVVLYNPDDTIFKNIPTYLDEVETLFIVDNSETTDLASMNKLKNLSPKIVYIDNRENQGIAHALNVGADSAIEHGSKWLLTMDQDSKFEKNALFEMLQWIQINETTKVGIVSPVHHEDEVDNHDFIMDLNTMTSGCLLNLSIFQKIGPFDTKLFIDSVDTEYCLRLNSLGYNIKRLRSIVLKHNLGEQTREKLLFVTFTVSNHSSLRRYYIMRNRLYTWQKYYDKFPKFVRYEQWATTKECIKIILGERKKVEKFKMMWRGYIDFKRNRFGKYDW